MKPLRILSLSTEFPHPSEPGKGLFVWARLQAMASSAHLTVISPVALFDYANPRNKLLASLEIPPNRSDAGIVVLHPRWFYPPYGGCLNAFFLFARLVVPAARLQKQGACDLIDAHFAHPEGIAAALLNCVLKLPFVITLRGSELRYRRQRCKRFWMAWAIRRASRVIAVSDNLRDLAIELGAEPSHVKVIPNGINADLFFPRDQTACRRQHGIAASDKVILSAGDLAELKGHHRVIRALRTLVQTGLPVRLLIVGGVGRSGRYADTLRKLVVECGLEDRVRFVGEVKQEVLAELMCAVDVFCLASSTEGWPNVVNEALACGTPVVATDVGAVRQMIISSRYGSIVPVEDACALVDALKSALTQYWDQRAISDWGKARSWDQVAAEVLEQAKAAAGVKCRES